MALPEQIRKQTEAVQELYKQLNAGQDQGEGNPPADAPAIPAATTADENTAPNDAAPSPAPEQKVGDDKATEDFAQKYKTLQGMYNAEVPRLHQQNREMTQRIQQMEQLLASMSSQTTPVAPEPAAQPTKLVSDKDVEEYGESIDVMRKVSREELGSVTSRLTQLETMLKQLQTNVVPQVQAVAQQQAVSSEQRFWSDLTSAVSNWREVNDNPAFQAWLLETDPLTGITRQTYLEDAQRALDARRVSAFFRTWLESTGQAVAQPQGSAPASTNSQLEKQVTPGRARNAGTPQTSKGKVYTPADITKFFNDVRSGKYKGREQERDRIERDIFAAQREDRIQATA
jgi:hypothetical protein